MLSCLKVKNRIIADDQATLRLLATLDLSQVVPLRINRCNAMPYDKDSDDLLCLLAGGALFSRDYAHEVIIVRSQPEQHCSSASASTTCVVETVAAAMQDGGEDCPDATVCGQEATSAAELVVSSRSTPATCFSEVLHGP